MQFWVTTPGTGKLFPRLFAALVLMLHYPHHAF